MTTTTKRSATAPNPPRDKLMPRPSILAGVWDEAARILGVSNLKHRSALKKLGAVDGVELATTMYSRIKANHDRGGGLANKDSSKENWRWPSLNTKWAPQNASPEVLLERAIVLAASDPTEEVWGNQIPVASGLISGARDSRRAIDLVRKKGERHFEFIELKIASDTPLFAAIEILGYGCLWLLARSNRPSRPSPLLDAEVIDLRVLAPIKYYNDFSLRHLEQALDEGVRRLADAHHVRMGFRFEILDPRLWPDRVLERADLISALDRSLPLDHERTS